jgi:hypothetical protein
MDVDADGAAALAFRIAEETARVWIPFSVKKT